MIAAFIYYTHVNNNTRNNTLAKAPGNDDTNTYLPPTSAADHGPIANASMRFSDSYFVMT